MRVVALPDFSEDGVGDSPELRREYEGVEALRRRVAEVLFQRAAVLAGPNLVESGLHHGEEVPAVGGEHVEGVAVDVVCQHRREAQVLGSSSGDEAAGQVADGSRETRSVFCVHPPDFSIALTILLSPVGFDFLLNDRKRFRILLRLLEWPITEVDDTATGHLIRFVVEFLSVDDRHDHVGVVWVVCAYSLGIIVGQ